jgi:two-component system capsular synthesis response regulator RcsB
VCITDLYFEVDHARQNLSGGAALIVAARKVQPDLRVLVFSAESKAAVIEALFEKYGIDGYVRKARNDARDLKMAIEYIDRNERYLPKHLAELVKRKNIFDFKEFDMAILSLMAEGVRQKDLPDKLRERNFEKSSLSTIEKRLKTIREVLEFTNNEQLIAYCKDMGIV